jgi:SAM-dependent methyltransferase
VISQQLFRRYYPGDSFSGTKKFYDWIWTYARPDSALLNVGAGPASGSPVRSFKGRVRYAAGADIDPIVLTNHELDDARLISEGRLPFDSQSFDIVVSDFVLEHVAQPIPFLREIHRVLTRGGSFFFRTPNRWHYVSIAGRLTPHWFHKLVANRVRGLAEEAHEPYPTLYRLNGRGCIGRRARAAGFGKVELRMCEAEPSYLLFNQVAFLAGVAYERLVNRFEGLGGLRANIFGRLEA